ncbi:hypothetical protein QC283_13305 [Streptomyces sp. DH41]|nr:hypothetical protein [Streptomyces sp. DH41]MDG9723768.1 hypothetical protein [Streptomyces sp. DH41]
MSAATASLGASAARCRPVQERSAAPSSGRHRWCTAIRTIGESSVQKPRRKPAQAATRAVCRSLSTRARPGKVIRATAV